jgi:hypothetical protein
MRFKCLFSLLVAVSPLFSQQIVSTTPEWANTHVTVEAGVPVEVAVLKYDVTGTSIRIESIELRNKGVTSIEAFQVVWNVYSRTGQTVPIAFKSDKTAIEPGHSSVVEGLTVEANAKMGIDHISGRLAYVRFADGKEFGKIQ